MRLHHLSRRLREKRLHVGVDVSLCCMVYLSRCPLFPVKMKIISDLPDVPQGEKGRSESKFSSVVGDEVLKGILDAVLFRWDILSYDRRSKGKPNLGRQMAVEEQV